MARPRHKGFLEFPFKRLSNALANSQKDRPISIERRDNSNLKSVIPSFNDSTRFRSDLPQKMPTSKFGKQKLVGDVPSKSTINGLVGESPLRARNADLNDWPNHETSFHVKKVTRSSMVTKALLQKERAAPGFMSILKGEGRLVRHKASTQTTPQRVRRNAREVESRLPQAKRLQFLQALLKKPLPFLDLHVSFGVSKEMVERLVKNGFLKEVWGSNAIGVTFRLTDRGKTYLRELEASVRFEPKIKEKSLIKLKNKV
jgi:hypothetical protein